MTPFLIDKQDYPELAFRLEKELGFNRPGFEKGYFSNGEFFCRFLEPLKNQDVYVLQPCISSQDFMELFVIIQAAQKNGARSIILVLPFLSYMRQDRMAHGSGVPAHLIMKLLEVSGVTHIITFDLHSQNNEQFFSIPVHNLYFGDVIAQKLLNEASRDLKDWVVVAPDRGATARARRLSERLQVPLIGIEKRRIAPGQSLTIDINGNIMGKRCLILDDLVDSGNTLCESARFLIEKGAQSAEGYVTHGVLSGKALETIEESSLTKLTLSNTVPLSRKSPKIRMWPIEDLLFENLKMFPNL